MNSLVNFLIILPFMPAFLSQISYAQPISKLKKQFDKVLEQEDIHSGFFLDRKSVV